MLPEGTTGLRAYFDTRTRFREWCTSELKYLCPDFFQIKNNGNLRHHGEAAILNDRVLTDQPGVLYEGLSTLICSSILLNNL